MFVLAMTHFVDIDFFFTTFMMYIHLIKILYFYCLEESNLTKVSNRFHDHVNYPQSHIGFFNIFFAPAFTV